MYKPDSRFVAFSLVFTVFLYGALLSSCSQSWESASSEKTPPYTCLGDCVPIRFEVFVPKERGSTHGVFLSGSFNGWAHEDEPLRFETEGRRLERALKSVGLDIVDDGGSFDVHWATVKLPAGSKIQYRYSIASTRRYGHAEKFAYRELDVEEGLLVRDSVHQWDSRILRSGSWFLGEMVDNQAGFLGQAMTDLMQRPKTVAQTDSLYLLADKIWKEKGLKTYPGFGELLSETYLRTYYAQDNADWKPYGRGECHMYEAYMMPASVKELEFAKKEIHYENYTLMDSGNMLLTAIYCDELTDESWANLERILEEVPLLYDAYLEKLGSEKDDAITRILNSRREGFLGRAALYEPEFAFQKMLRGGELDLARKEMEDVIFYGKGEPITKGHARTRLAYFAKQMARSYKDSGQAERALDFLDTLTGKTTWWELPNDSLEVLYSEINGQKGVSRFRQVASMVNRDILKRTGKVVDLAGSYLNLTDSTMFDLATLKGKKVIFDFWTTWCPSCIYEIPDLIAFQSEVADREDLVFISVSEDPLTDLKASREQIEGFLKNQGVNYIVLYDDPSQPISRYFNLRYFPAKFLVDEMGNIVSEIKSVSDAL